MKCAVPDCSHAPVIHIVKVAARTHAGQTDVCAHHAKNYPPLKQLHSQSRRHTQETAAYFDLEFMVFFDEFAKAGIYLRQVGGDRHFSFSCGHFESTYLYDAIRNPLPRRPFIHAVMVSAIQALDGKLELVLIDAFEEQVFHAKLHILQGERLIAIDSRPTDAFALAIVCDVPILIAESVLNKTQTDST